MLLLFLDLFPGVLDRRGIGKCLNSAQDIRHFLEYPPSSAKWLILLIEAVATVSIAAILLALFSGGTLRSTEQSHQIPPLGDDQ